jgi:hypothetical protein
MRTSRVLPAIAPPFSHDIPNAISNQFIFVVEPSDFHTSGAIKNYFGHDTQPNRGVA